MKVNPFPIIAALGILFMFATCEWKENMEPESFPSSHSLPGNVGNAAFQISTSPCSPPLFAKRKPHHLLGKWEERNLPHRKRKTQYQRLAKKTPRKTSKEKGKTRAGKKKALSLEKGLSSIKKSFLCQLHPSCQPHPSHRLPKYIPIKKKGKRRDLAISSKVCGKKEKESKKYFLLPIPMLSLSLETQMLSLSPEKGEAPLFQVSPRCAHGTRISISQILWNLSPSFRGECFFNDFQLYSSSLRKSVDGIFFAKGK